MGSDPYRPAVSVIVPVYNGQATIRECLESLLRLRYPPDRVELIVVDNGSTDATPALLTRFQDRCRILVEEKRGPAAARNRGIRAARGECIALTDADCVVDPEWLAELVQPLASSDVGISGGRILSVEPCNRIERFGELIHDHRRALEEFVPPYAISMNWASRRAVLLEAGLFDESLLRGEDVDLAWRVRAAGLRLAYRDSARIQHHNERTLGGLLAEGYAHGYYAVPVRRKHEAGLRAAGDAGYFPVRQLLRHAAGTLRGAGRRESFYRFVFDLGKAVGHFTASARAGGRTETLP